MGKFDKIDILFMCLISFSLFIIFIIICIILHQNDVRKEKENTFRYKVLKVIAPNGKERTNEKKEKFEPIIATAADFKVGVPSTVQPKHAYTPPSKKKLEPVKELVVPKEPMVVNDEPPKEVAIDNIKIEKRKKINVKDNSKKTNKQVSNNNKNKVNNNVKKPKEEINIPKQKNSVQTKKPRVNNNNKTKKSL